MPPSPRAGHRSKGWLLASHALAVALVLTLCDWAFHVRNGVLRYAEPEVGNLLPGHPTAQVFGGFLLIGAVCTVTGARLFARSPSPGPLRAAMSIVVFVLAYAASGRFSDAPMALSAAFLGTWALHLYAYRDAVHTRVAFCAALGVGGPLLEGWYTTTGFFAYTAPQAYYVPMWLSGLYLHGGLAVAASVATLTTGRSGARAR